MSFEYAPLPLSLSPPGARRMVYCRAVRLIESPPNLWLTSLSCRCFVSMDLLKTIVVLSSTTIVVIVVVLVLCGCR